MGSVLTFDCHIGIVIDKMEPLSCVIMGFHGCLGGRHRTNILFLSEQ